MMIFRRPVERHHGTWHPHVSGQPARQLLRGGAMALAPLTGPAGLTGPVGRANAPYQGMDPSDPTTWVRQYRPAPGMIALLNFDGAMPNQTQATGGRQVPRRRRR